MSKTPDAIVLTHALEHARLVIRNSNAEPAHALELLKKILLHPELDEVLVRIRRDYITTGEHQPDDSNQQ